MRISRYVVDYNGANGHGPNGQAPNGNGPPPGLDSELIDEPSV
jgi:hypothetical protein